MNATAAQPYLTPVRSLRRRVDLAKLSSGHNGPRCEQIDRLLSDALFVRHDNEWRKITDELLDMRLAVAP